MAHLRRIHFQSRKCCSTVSVASMPDFSDSYFEELKKKIRLIAKDKTPTPTTTTSKSTEPSDTKPAAVIAPVKTSEPKSEPQSDTTTTTAAVVNNQNNGVFQPDQQTAVIFSLKNQVTGLVRALRVFQEFNINVRHIESRKSRRKDSQYELYVDIDCEDKEKMKLLLHHLRHEVDCCTLEEFKRSENSPKSKECPMSIPSILTTQSSFDKGDLVGDNGMIWFPKRITEIDLTSNRVLMYGTELDADHPGFKDPVYRERRKFFTDLAMGYKHGHPIPKVNYTEEETGTWGIIFSELKNLYKEHACKEFNDNLALLELYCGYRPNNIPQLEDISQFLKQHSGFQLRPVAGYLSSRDFLAGLAFRVFHCTQYIRHSSDPFYTPEPDCCHELLGHCPLLADQNFAQFSQELGLASLGAKDEEVDKLATCYFFTIEFGLCKQQNELKVYGAGLLSSVAELKHSVSGSAHILSFDPILTCQQEPMITTFQKVYFFTESFNDAKEQMREFAKTIKRPFGVRYNPYTQSVEILSNTRKIMNLVSELRGDLCIVTNALAKINDDPNSNDNGEQCGSVDRDDCCSAHQGNVFRLEEIMEHHNESDSDQSPASNKSTHIQEIISAVDDLNIPFDN